MFLFQILNKEGSTINTYKIEIAFEVPPSGDPDVGTERWVVVKLRGEMIVPPWPGMRITAVNPDGGHVYIPLGETGQYIMQAGEEPTVRFLGDFRRVDEVIIPELYVTAFRHIGWEAEITTW